MISLKDQYLRPLRDQMKELIHPGSKVLDVGCGNGDFLLHIADGIDHGVGIDMEGNNIIKANQTKNEKHIQNIDFVKADFTTFQPQEETTFDYATASLLLHALPRKDALQALAKLSALSDIIIIAAFCQPNTLKDRFLLWLDQRFSLHYRNFRTYQKQGYMEGLLKEAHIEPKDIIDTFDGTIKIYVL